MTISINSTDIDLINKLFQPELFHNLIILSHNVISFFNEDYYEYVACSLTINNIKYEEKRSLTD